MATRMKIHAADIIIIALSLAAVGASIFFAASGSAGTPRLLVRTDAGEFVYPLDKDARIEAKGPLGSTLIVIEGGKARIADSPCDNKLCIGMGAVEKKGQWASCLPNHVFLNVSGGAGKEEVDAGAY
jgi:hypothetical protein